MISQFIKTSRILFVSCLFTSYITAQPIVKLWDKTLGGSKFELFSTNLIVTANKQIIFASESASDSGLDKSQNSYQPIPTPANNNPGTWLISLDKYGNKLWDKVVGGRIQTLPLSLAMKNNNSFYLSCSIQNQDTTFDLTAPVNYSLNNSKRGLWLYNFDSLGNSVSNYRYVPNNINIRYSNMVLDTLSNSMYVLGMTEGSTVSLGGDFTLFPCGGDFFYTKIDLNLNQVVFNKYVGGTSGEMPSNILEGWNNRYLLAGATYSPISCNQTVGVWQQTGSTVKEDYFLASIDSNGNDIWQKHFGGYNREELLDIIKTADFGYLLIGCSNSIQGLDISQSWPLLNGNQQLNTWVVKIDSLGNKQWDKKYGSCNSPTIPAASVSSSVHGFWGSSKATLQCSTGGYIIANYILDSIPSCDITETSKGKTDVWLVKIDVFGNKVWDKRFGSNSNSSTRPVSLVELDTGIYVLSAITDGGVGNDKTEPSRGLTDNWLICFADTTIATLTGYEEINRKNVQFNIWPNPTNQTLYYSIANTVKVEQIQVINLLGEVVLRAENLLDNTINVASLQAGTYIISAKLNNNALVRKRFVVVK
jgi:hypothetical protein